MYCEVTIELSADLLYLVHLKIYIQVDTFKH